MNAANTQYDFGPWYGAFEVDSAGGTAAGCNGQTPKTHEDRKNTDKRV
jgi:hypothetical protein